MASTACTLPERAISLAREMTTPSPSTPDHVPCWGVPPIGKLPPWDEIKRIVTDDVPKQEEVSLRKYLEKVVLDLFSLDVARTIVFRNHTDLSSLSNYGGDPKLFNNNPRHRLKLLQMLLSIVEDLLYSQEAGYIVAIPVWLELLCTSAPYLLNEPKVPVHQFMLVVDEALMAVCRSLLYDGGLADTRKAIFELSDCLEVLSLVRKGETWLCLARSITASSLVPRLMQFIHELRRRSTFQIVVLEVAGKHLPMELTDFILSFITADDPILSKGSRFESAWGAPPQAQLDEFQHKSRDCMCCSHQVDSGTTCPDMYSWSLNEHRYVQYHECWRPPVQPETLLLPDPLNNIRHALCYLRCDEPGKQMLSTSAPLWNVIPLDARIYFKQPEKNKVRLKVGWKHF